MLNDLYFKKLLVTTQNYEALLLHSLGKGVTLVVREQLHIHQDRNLCAHTNCTASMAKKDK